MTRERHGSARGHRAAPPTTLKTVSKDRQCPCKSEQAGSNGLENLRARTESVVASAPPLHAAALDPALFDTPIPDPHGLSPTHAPKNANRARNGTSATQRLNRLLPSRGTFSACVTAFPHLLLHGDWTLFGLGAGRQGVPTACTAVRGSASRKDSPMGEANQEGSATTWRTRVRSTMRVLGYVSKELGTCTVRGPCAVANAPLERM